MPERLMRIVILALLLTAPLYSAAEIGAYMRGVSIDQRVAVTPLAVKLIKDAGFALIFVLAVLAQKKRPWRALAFAAPFGLAALASIALTLAQRGPNPMLILAGLRWLLPFVVAAALAGLPDRNFIPKMALALAAVFLLSFGLQIFQAFYIVPGWGFTAQGLAFRPPGIFTTANSAAFLAAISMWAAWFYLRGSPLRGPVLLFAPLSVALAASGAGIVAVAAFVFLLMGGRRWLRARLILGPVLAALILLALPVLTGRRDILQGSLFGRAGIFEQAARSAGFISDQFGAGTNSAVLLRSSSASPDDQAAIVDSTYTSALVNTGWAGLAALCAILIALWVMALRRATRFGEMQPLTLLGLFTVMGFSTIITEAFPMSLVMAAAIGQYVAPRAEPLEAPPKRRLDWVMLAVFGAAVILMLAPVAPYEYLVSRAAQSLDAPSAKTPAQLDALEADLRSAARLMPMRPAAYAHLAKVAGLYAAQNNFARALDNATFATLYAPNDPATRKEAGAVFALFEQKMASPPFANDIAGAFPSVRQKVKMGGAAAWLGRSRAALFWYQQAKLDGANSRLFWRNLAAALRATGNTAQGYEAYAQSIAPSTPDDLNIDMDALPNPTLNAALDAFDSAVCKTSAREDEVAGWLAADPNWLLKLAGDAADQRRWADALLCYKKDEQAFAGDASRISARPPGPALRRAVAAALAQSKDAPAYLEAARVLEPSFAVVLAQDDLSLAPSALRWLRPKDGAGTGFGGPFADEAKPGVFAAAGNAGALAQMDRAGQFEWSAELGFAPGITPTSPITLALGFDEIPQAVFVLQPGQLGWQLAVIQAQLPAGYHTLDVWQVAPPQGGAAVNRARLRRLGN